MSELVSVIIPMYNVEDYIENCLNSIISQTYRNIEIILVNDGSSDNTLYICERYAKDDDRIKIFSQRNKGVSSARNLALNNIKGKYFLFVDSDDFIGKDHISNLYNYEYPLPTLPFLPILPILSPIYFLKFHFLVVLWPLFSVCPCSKMYTQGRVKHG